MSITMEDHGVLTFSITLEGNGTGCVFGHYVIGHGYLGAKEFKAENGHGLEAMMRIMDTVGVERWEDLQGKYVRFKSEGLGHSVDTIGNIIKDKWFNIKEFFASKKEGGEHGNT